MLSLEKQLSLLREVTAEEVREVVWYIPMHKSPGPDGFGSGFYRHAWNAIGLDVRTLYVPFSKMANS